MKLPKSKARLLLVEDNMNDADLVNEYIKADGDEEFSLHHVTTIADAAKAIEKENFDAILADISLPDSSGLDTITTIQAKAAQSAIIALTGNDDDEFALKVVAAGAQDYLVKDQMNARLLKRTIYRALERNQMFKALRESETRFRAMIENSLGFIFTHDLNGTLLSVNKAAAKNLGYEPQEAIGKNISTFVQPSYRPRMLEYLSNILSHHLTDGIMYALTKNGESRIWEYRNLLFDQGVEKYVIGFAQDVTARIHSENTLKDTNLRLTNSLQEIQQRTLESTILGEMTDLLLACQQTDDVFNLAINAVQQLFSDRFHGGIFEVSETTNNAHHRSSWGNFLPLMQDFPVDACIALKTRKLHRSNRAETHCAHTVGTKSQNAFCIPLLGNHRLLGLLYFEDLPDVQHQEFLARQENLLISIAEQASIALTNVHLREDLRNQAIRDALTGLFNRRYVEEWLERELLRSARYNRPLSLAFIDIDHFKVINDTYGHPSGDQVLQHLAKLMRAVLRRTDLIGRYGGEEFIIVFPETSLAHTQALAEKIRVSFSALNVKTDTQLLKEMTLSIGLSSFPEHGTNVAELIEAADRAVYRAKKEGRNRVVLHDVNSS